jgi:hypothetical protein
MTAMGVRILWSVIGSSVSLDGVLQLHLSRLPGDLPLAYAHAGRQVLAHSARRALTAEFSPQVRTLTLVAVEGAVEPTKNPWPEIFLDGLVGLGKAGEDAVPRGDGEPGD